MAARASWPRRWPGRSSPRGRRPRLPAHAGRARRLRPRAHRVRTRRVPARDRGAAPAALPGGAARQRGRGRPGAPHAGRRLPVREQARRSPARVPQAAGAAPRLPVRPAAGSAAGRRLLQRRAQGRRGDHRRDGEAAPRARQEARGRGRAARRRAAAHAADRRPLRTAFVRGQLRPVRRGPVPERPAAQGLAVPRRGGGAGRGVGGRVRDQPRALRPGAAAQVHRARSRWASRARRDRSITRRKTRRARCSASRSSAAALFFAVAIWGVIDAIHHHQPEVPLPDRRQGRARAFARRASHVFAQRPRRLPGRSERNR